MADKTRAQILGENLKRIRESKGISRKQLAEAVGVTEVSISGYENGHKLPPLDKIFNLANALETSIIGLTGDTGYNPDFPKAADINRNIFEYRFERAKKMLAYLDPIVSSFDDYALEINEYGNVSISSAERITYKNGVITTYGKRNSITFRSKAVFVDAMERAEHRALYQQIPLNQALNELVEKMIAESKKE